MQLEVCIETLQEAKLAEHYKCHRIEICSALNLGGLTPSYGLIQACTSLPNIESHILIRPRAGDFIYSLDELNLMKEDIKIAADLGANGVVFGCLDTNEKVDFKSCSLLIQFAKNLQLQTTFHRAIDFAKDYQQAIKTIIELGFDRILSSGQRETALQGINNILSAVNNFSDQIEIMAGSGIDAENAVLFKEIGTIAIHFSIRNKSISAATLNMGISRKPDEKKLSQIIKKIHANENN